MNIVVPQPAANIGSQVSSLLRVLEAINGSGDETDNLDLTNIRFFTPLFSLSLSSIINNAMVYKKNISFSYPNSRDCQDYLNTINFPKGTIIDQNSEDFHFDLDYYRGKNYLPIIYFPTSEDARSTYIRDTILTRFNQLVRDNLNLNIEYYNALCFLVSELTDNIVDHSGIKNGWLTFQYYPRRELLDISIIDSGITILGSYIKHGIENITTAGEAISSAINGLSTKGKERGVGLSTSKHMIISGLQGEFGLFSGSGFLLNNNYYQMPTPWNGTILALRIKGNVPNFNYIAFV